MTNIGGDSDRIGKQVIDRRQARAGCMSPCGHLDRGWLAGEHSQSIAFRVAGQVNQNVDLIGPDTICQLIVGPLLNGPPSVGQLSEGARYIVLDGCTGIADYFEAVLVVVLQHGSKRECGRTTPELGGYVAQDDSSARIAIILVLRRVLRGNVRSDPAPPLGSRRLMLREVGVGAEVQGIELVRQRRLVVRSDRERTIEERNGSFCVALMRMTLADLDKRLDRAWFDRKGTLARCNSVRYSRGLHQYAGATEPG